LIDRAASGVPVNVSVADHVDHARPVSHRGCPTKRTLISAHSWRSCPQERSKAYGARAAPTESPTS